MRLRNVLLATGVGLILLLAGPVYAQDEGGDPERGAELWTQNCVVCHGSKGEGRVGATLSDVFVSVDADVALTQIISQGREGTYMPAWDQAYGGPLTAGEVQDIVAYIESWGTTYEPPEPAPPRPAVEIPPVPELSGDPNVGYTVYRQNCAVCHGEQGEGRIGATLKTTFAALDPGDFATSYALTTIQNGIFGSQMPAFAQERGGPLTAQEIDDVAAYLFSIQEAPPVQEGEQIGKGSAWPLLIVGLLSVLIVVALGIAMQRGEEGDSPRTE